MTRFSELTGVAHNIAHHAGSGLSCLSPHLARALRAAGLATTEIELLTPRPYPARAAESEPLAMALASLRETVERLLQTHGFASGSVASVVLHATPAPWDAEGHTLHTRAVIVSSHGRAYDSGWLA